MLFYKPTNTSILGQERAEAQIDRGSGKQGEEAECQAIAAQTPHRPQLNHMHTNTFTPVYSPLYYNSGISLDHIPITFTLPPVQNSHIPNKNITFKLQFVSQSSKHA